MSRVSPADAVRATQTVRSAPVSDWATRHTGRVHHLPGFTRHSSPPSTRMRCALTLLRETSPERTRRSRFLVPRSLYCLTSSFHFSHDHFYLTLSSCAFTHTIYDQIHPQNGIFTLITTLIYYILCILFRDTAITIYTSSLSFLKFIPLFAGNSTFWIHSGL